MSSGSTREPVGALLQHLVEEPPEVLVEVLGGLLEHLRELVGLEHADLAVEALEEAHVAGLVGDLRAEEDFLVLGGRGAHDRPELLGDFLLADEEGGEPVHALEALFLVELLVPVLAVAAEVELLGLPLLALPEQVELLVGEQLDLGGPVGGLHQRRDRWSPGSPPARSSTGSRLTSLEPMRGLPLNRVRLPGGEHDHLRGGLRLDVRP